MVNIDALTFLSDRVKICKDYLLIELVNLAPHSVWIYLGPLH
jgi:hypothetical protein